MTFKEIYNPIIQLWGNKIEFSDGSDSNPANTTGNSENTNIEDNYFLSQLLSKQWNVVEQTVDSTDNFGSLMVWTMFQVFHKKARQLFKQSIFEFDPKSINKNEIEEQYYKNLNEEGWELELVNYKREIE